MQKIIFALLATCAACTAAVMKSPFVLNDRWSILKCSNGNLTGLDDFVQLFQTVVDTCEGKENSRAFYECVGSNLAIVEDDGTPSVEKMNNLFLILFSEMILEDVPAFKEELNGCAKDYVSNFNEIGEIAESSEVFFQCFTGATENFSAEIEGVCKLEDAINGDYYRTHNDQ